MSPRIDRASAWLLLASTALGCAAHKAAAPPAVPAPEPVVAGGPVSPRAERMFGDANDLYAEQDKLGALNFAELEYRYQEAAATDPSFAEPEYNLGALYQREGKLDLAAQAYTEALKRRPDLTRAAEALAIVKEAQGRDADAASVLEATAKSYPRDAGVRARLAEMSLRRGDADRAREWARGALMRDPRNIVAYQVLLELAFRQGDDDLVSLLALKAQKAQPQAAAPAYYLGRVAEKHHDDEKATAQFRAAAAAKPDFEPAYAELASMAMAHQDFAGAEAALRKVLQLDPRACAAHLDLGIAERGLQKTDIAASEYQEALRCDGRLVQAYYDMGLLQHRVSNDCGAAIESYRKFISGNAAPLPGDHPVFAALQECQQRQAQDEQRKLEQKQEPPAAPGAGAQGTAPPAPSAARPPPAEGTPPQPSQAGAQAPGATPGEPAEPQN